MFNRATTKYVCGIDQHAKTLTAAVMVLSGMVLAKGTVPCRIEAVMDLLGRYVGEVAVGLESTYNCAIGWRTGCTGGGVRDMLRTPTLLRVRPCGNIHPFSVQPAPGRLHRAVAQQAAVQVHAGLTGTAGQQCRPAKDAVRRSGLHQEPGWYC